MLYFAKWKIALIAVVCLLGAAYASPNLMRAGALDGLPGWMPSKQISLGLDLQGGSHLLLEVDVDTVIRERLEAVVDAIRFELRKENVGYRNLGVRQDAAVVTIRLPEDFERAREVIRKLDNQTATAIDGDGNVTVTLTEQAKVERIRSAVEQSIEIVRRRIDETGVREPTIIRQGDDRVLVQLPGIDDPERIKSLLGKTAKLTFHLEDHENSLTDALAGRVPAGSILVPALDELGPDGRPRMYLVQRRVVVGGENLVDAQPSFNNAGPVVSFRFDTIGGKRFGDATSANVNRNLAIMLDGKIISAPRINEPILGGSGIITGRFSVQETQDLALLLRAGALPAPLVIIEERTVGPGLGADSIAAGKIASIIGLVGVVVFMVLTYGLFGLIANVALLFNIVLIMGALSLFQATLTLPGIAGIVLTIGMAVDANVLIFERIRDEARGGRGPISAIDAGFKRAIATIVDANVTTLIAAVLLFAFGSGPVKGFAVTLGIGIATSLFTATMLTRLIIATWVRRRRPQALPI